MPKLKFRNIQWEIFCADLVESSHNAALQDRPEAFDGLSMNRADNILPLGVINFGVAIMAFQAAIADPLVSANQADLVRYRLVDEGR
jgi:hypothetical protein